MNAITKTGKLTLGKANLAQLPENVAREVKLLCQEDGVARFSLTTRNEGYEFYFGEGYKVTVMRDESVASVNMGSQDSLGSLDYWNIGARVAFPAGTFIINNVLFCGQYFVEVTAIMPKGFAVNAC